MYTQSSLAATGTGRHVRAHSARQRAYGADTAYSAARPRAARSGVDEATFRPAFAATLPAIRADLGRSNSPASLPPPPRHRPRTTKPRTSHSAQPEAPPPAANPRRPRPAAKAPMKTPTRLPPLERHLLAQRAAAEHTVAAAGDDNVDIDEDDDDAEYAPSRRATAVVAAPKTPSPPPAREETGPSAPTTPVDHAVVAVVAPQRPSHPLLQRLEALLTTAVTRSDGNGDARASVAASVRPPVWELAEMYTLAANAEAVRCSAMAMPLEETYAYYHEALHYVAPPPPTRQTDVFTGAAPDLQRVLAGLVRSNIAVEQRQSFSCAPHETQLSLLRALSELDGALATLVLYNLASLFFSEGQMEDATEAIARCVELAQSCLTVPVPYSHTEAPLSLAQRRARAVHRTFITHHATHLVLCHLLIATFAAWCGEEAEVEQYHCQLAAGCATTYLPVSHPLRHRCMKRMAAAQSRVHRTTSAVADGDSLPPPQPLLFYGDLLPILDHDAGSGSQDTADERGHAEALWWWYLERGDGTIIGGTAAAAAADAEMCTAWLSRPVLVSELLVFSRCAAHPAELEAYVADTRGALLQRAAATEITHTRVAAWDEAEVDDSLQATLRDFGARLAVARGHVDPQPATPVPSTAPAPPKSATPPVVSALPGPVFSRYRKLKASTAEAVGRQPEVTNSTAHASTSAAAAAAAGGALVDSPRHVQSSLHQMDRELLRYSHLVPVDTDDVVSGEQLSGARARLEAALSSPERAARRIQRGYRCHQARSRSRERTTAVLAERERQIAAGEVAGASDHCDAADEEAHREAAAACVLQRLARRHLARQRVAAARDRQERLVWVRRRAAARCLARRRHAQLQERRLQRLWEPHALAVQRWWRGCVVQRRQLLSGRQAAVAAHLAAQESAFDGVVGATSWDAAQAARTVVAVLHGARDRAALAVQHARMQRAKAILLRWVWRRRGQQLLARQTEDHAIRWQARRIAELETDAAMVIQAWVRGCLCRCRLRRRPAPDEAARRIQSRWRRHRHQQDALASYRAAQQYQLEQYAATLVQATWRMYRTRRQVAAQLQFLLWDRHVYAQRIQRQWRAWHAGQVVLRECGYVARREALRQADERRYVAAARIQATVRMFLARLALSREGLVPLWPVQVRSGVGARAVASHAPQRALSSSADSDDEEDSDDEQEQEQSDEDEEDGTVPCEVDSLEGSGSIHSRDSVTTAPPPPRSQTPTDELQRQGTAEPAELDSPCSSVDNNAAREDSPMQSPTTDSLEQSQAATVIQKHWRGYQVRKRYEFYYEVYYEEVEVTDDEAEEEEEEEEDEEEATSHSEL